MKIIADLHIHSHYSRATSKSLNPENLFIWAKKKGISILGTGDFTHPGWIAELQEKLTEAEKGLYRIRPDLKKALKTQLYSSCSSPVRFVLSGEISCIYKKGGKTRKAHHLILMPDFESAKRLNRRLDKIGNILSDGRPILGIDSRNLLELTLEADDRALFIPAHIWTPWFSLFGSKSGFDTIEECFEDLTGHIHALETGLSSDPPMNRLISKLDDFLLISNSDAHSPSKLGREANVLEIDLDYDCLALALTKGTGFHGTVEFFPQEGKYHLDGHRKCNIRCHPEETLRLKGICPVCGRPLTVGVLNRIFQLSDRRAPKISKDFVSLIPLAEVISELLNCGPATKKVQGVYEGLLNTLGPELNILLDLHLSDLEEAGGAALKEAIFRMRQNRIICKEGYDGEYGTIHLFDDSEKFGLCGQMALFSDRSKKVGPSKNKLQKPDLLIKDKSRPGLKKPPISDHILDTLNQEQAAAVKHSGGHLLVVAGPGTGKTLTLTHRIAYLIREKIAKQEQILALTFTRKAAREMELRLGRLLHLEKPGAIHVSTFHRFCLDMLRNNADKAGFEDGFSLCTEFDAEYIAQEAIEASDQKGLSLKKFLNGLALYKGSDLMGQRHLPLFDNKASPFSLYQDRLKAMSMLDLYDLEIEALRLLREDPDLSSFYSEKYPWLFVDEYQDTNPLQAEVLKMIAGAGKTSLFAIGDPDQAIYGFRGSDVENFHRFHTDFPGAKEVILKRNYRSTETILKGAAALLHNAPLETKEKGGFPVFHAPCNTDDEEAEMIVEQVERFMGGTSYFSLDSGRVESHEGDESLSFGDIGVLYRLNAQGDKLEKAFRRAGIPFVRSGEKPLVKNRSIELIWRYLQCCSYPENPFFPLVYEKILANLGLRDIRADISIDMKKDKVELVELAIEKHRLIASTDEEKEAVDRFRLFADEFNGSLKGFLDFLSLERGIDHSLLMGDRVALMSLHSAKGLEWPVVFITGCEDGIIPMTLFGDGNLEEEKRLFYVGMTRAKSRLVISHAKKRGLKGQVLFLTPSPFISSIPISLLNRLERRGWHPKKRPYKQMELF